MCAQLEPVQLSRHELIHEFTAQHFNCNQLALGYAAFVHALGSANLPTERRTRVAVLLSINYFMNQRRNLS